MRNITHASLNPLSQINILHGHNGAGKTSVLESLSLLSAGKSFRSHKLDPLIQNNLEHCVAFGEVNIDKRGFQPVGVERSRTKSQQAAVIKIAGERVHSAASLAENLPLQVIYSDTFKLLEGSPAVRRQFLDWGVFHVEHRYFPLWKSARRCLKQRNSLLRHDRIDPQQLAIWTNELALLGRQIDTYRQDYIRQLVPIFEATLDKLIDLDGIRLSYYRGWDKTLDLQDVLDKQLERDGQQGFTSFGPHRADLRIRYNNANAAETLSRGQQKLVICALRVAQGYLLSEIANKECLYLVDDLPAELDKERRRALCHLLEELGCQVVVTCVSPEDLTECWSNDADVTVFHVEHGVITKLNNQPSDGFIL